MKLQKLAVLMLLVSPLFTVQMVHAQDNVHQQVELSALAKLPVKTIVPITAKTKEQAIAQAKVIAANQDADLAEFRIDLLEFAADSKQVIALGHELKKVLGTKPMIATIRTHNEGGKLTISDADYGKTYQALGSGKTTQNG